MIISGTNKTKTKNDLSDDGEDDYTGRDIKVDNKHRSADSGVDAVLCVDKALEGPLCVLQFLFFRLS